MLEQQPTLSLCFPYDERVDSPCSLCGSVVAALSWECHVDWHVALWNMLQPAA